MIDIAEIAAAAAQILISNEWNAQGGNGTFNEFTAYLFNETPAGRRFWNKYREDGRAALNLEGLTKGTRLNLVWTNKQLLGSDGRPVYENERIIAQEEKRKHPHNIRAISDCARRAVEKTQTAKTRVKKRMLRIA